MRTIEKEIANLDKWQQAAAIECPDGPQRIRGLAGSGKTIVLALKAAYMHATQPNWNIAVVFYSRALYQQFRDLIRRFYFEQKADEPDWKRISVIHAWGSSSSPGLYSQVANAAGFAPRTFIYAKETYGQDRSFEGITTELLDLLEKSELSPRYDAILIDEAQDLPTAFFRLAFKFAKDPKRVTFAYDELQTLSESSMPSIAELFGSVNGVPTVSLENPDHGPRRDIVLPVCYRNTPWALTTAHALGLGVYAKKGLVQHFDDPALWEDVGYKVVTGALDYGSEVTLERKDEATPQYFKALLSPDDALICQPFETQNQQCEWIAKQIQADIAEGELDPDDILVVVPDPLTAQSRASALMRELSRLGIVSHVVGVTASRDEMVVPGSVAIAHIYRSKGNEAPMVYVMNCEDALRDYRRVAGRNTLFTAITRSRCWVRLCGVGPSMKEVEDEVKAVKAAGYRLHFRIPSQDELEKMKLISRDLSPKNEKKLKKAMQGIREIIELIRGGEIAVEQLPEDAQSAFNQLLAAESDDQE